MLNGDTDAEGDGLIVTNLTQPAQGSVVLNSDGTVTYTHNGSNTVSDSFTYTANDGVLESAIATVSITISPVNYPPTVNNDSLSVDEGGQGIIAILANDSDPDGDSLSVTNLTLPGQGTATLNPNNTVTLLGSCTVRVK